MYSGTNDDPIQPWEKVLGAVVYGAVAVSMIALVATIIVRIP